MGTTEDIYDLEEVLGKVQIEEDITRQLVDDIFQTAWEGGINYWVDWIDCEANRHITTEYNHQALTRGGIYMVYVQEPFQDDEDDQPILGYLMTLEKMLNGIKQFCVEYPSSPTKLMDDFDAGEADQMVQYALFGEVIYG
jgi:hypothetical protein